ncbi:MAG: phosphatidate cytidylyltransferase [Filimonas sp.]|nr:phosphatidate cytidylyltransferase [Filimonas sp.]
MIKRNYALLLIMLTVCLSSCEVIGGIFKAGVWVGILLVVVVAFIIIWLVSKAGSK